MATRLQPLNLNDFTGGLNLRADAFQLKDNESPEMLNVDVDPRGGVATRKGWGRYNTGVVGAGIAPWDPRSLHVWEKSDGTRHVLLAVDDNLFTASAGVFSQLSDGSGVIVGNASPHLIDFAEWGDTLYLACGGGNQSRKWTGSGSATRLIANAPTWQEDYTAPVGGYMPKAELCTTHQGYMFVANTNENSVVFPNRVRWSHPNSPENWASLDFIDILDGGSRITSIMSFSDHLVIFKPNSVWALYGYDPDSWALTNITQQVGAIHRNAACLAAESAFFYSHPNGVHEYRPGQGIAEVSTQLRPAIDSGAVNPQALTQLYIGWLNRRVWWSCPYSSTGTETDASAVFVHDPLIGAWTLYRDPNGKGLGPFATGGQAGDGALLAAAHRTSQIVILVDDNNDGGDVLDGVSATPFPTVYATKWLHAGWPSLQKSWRRPDYVVTEKVDPYSLKVTVYRDYDEANLRSQHVVPVETGNLGGTWGGFSWGDGTLWSAGARGAHIETGGQIGLARSIQLRFEGVLETSGKPWGLNAVVMKYRNRRFR